jgi:hypothetical protein
VQHQGSGPVRICSQFCVRDTNPDPGDNICTKITEPARVFRKISPSRITLYHCTHEIFIIFLNRKNPEEISYFGEAWIRIRIALDPHYDLFLGLDQEWQ